MLKVVDSYQNEVDEPLCILKGKCKYQSKFTAKEINVYGGHHRVLPNCLYRRTVEIRKFMKENQSQ